MWLNLSCCEPDLLLDEKLPRTEALLTNSASEKTTVGFGPAMCTSAIVLAPFDPPAVPACLAACDHSNNVRAHYQDFEHDGKIDWNVLTMLPWAKQLQKEFGSPPKRLDSNDDNGDDDSIPLQRCASTWHTHSVNGEHFSTYEEFASAARQEAHSRQTEFAFRQDAGTECKRKLCKRVYAKFSRSLGKYMFDLEDMRQYLLKLVAEQKKLDPSTFDKSWLSEVEHIFWRFDFSGIGTLNEEEAVMMAMSVMRHYRAVFHNKEDVREFALHTLPFKFLSSEFKLKNKLGKGGQGTVYLATCKRTNQERVVKFYSKSNKNVEIEDIKDEYSILASLDHPHVARIHEVFEDYSNVYIVGDPYFGGDLNQLMKNAKSAHVRVTDGWLAAVLKQAFEGVGYLHRRCLMHCDIKEENCMVVDAEWSNPQVVIIDFGLARNFCVRDFFAGTSGYIPPEVITDTLWTPKGDVHALGVMTYQMFTGRYAFEGSHADEIEHNTLVTDPDLRPLDQFRDLPELVALMLLKDFKLRPPVGECLLHDFFLRRCASDGDLDHAHISENAIQALLNVGYHNELQKAILEDVASNMKLSEMHELTEAFMAADTDHGGTVSAAELDRVLTDSGSDLDREVVKGIVNKLVDKDGHVTYTRFMAQLMTASAADEDMLLQQEFIDLDKDRSGYLEKSELVAMMERPALKALRQRGRLKDLAEVEKVFDQDGDGKVSIAEFIGALRGHDPMIATLTDMERRAAAKRKKRKPSKSKKNSAQK